MRISRGLLKKVLLLGLGLTCVPGFAAGRLAMAAAADEGVLGPRSVPDTTAKGTPERRGGLLRRTHPLAIQQGVLTVDGLTVKAGMNYRISDLHYMYVGVPGTGVVVIAEHPFSGAREEPLAFRGNTLTVLAGSSRVQLTAANRMRGHESAYVRFEPGDTPALRTPMLGFGEAALVPAVWSPYSSATPGGRRRLRVRARRALHTARLCRPSPEGRERCAIVREVVFER